MSVKAPTLVKKTRVVLAAATKVSAARLVRVLPYDGPGASYNQLEGVPLKLALLDANYKETHSPVMCKDYLTDAVWSETTGRTVSVYGFSWSKGKLDVSEVLRIGLHFDKAELAAKAPNILALVNKFDKAQKFPTSKLLPSEDPLHFVLVLDKAWAAQPMRISLVTLLSRIGTAYEPGESLDRFFDETSVSRETGSDAVRYKQMVNPGDGNQVQCASAIMLRLAAGKPFPKQTFEQYGSSNAIHSSSGIVAMSGEDYDGD